MITEKKQTRPEEQTHKTEVTFATLFTRKQTYLLHVADYFVELLVVFEEFVQLNDGVRTQLVRKACHFWHVSLTPDCLESAPSLAPSF